MVPGVTIVEGDFKWYTLLMLHLHESKLTVLGSVSYRGWGTWDFPSLSSSFPPQTLLTSAIYLYMYYIPTPESIMPPTLYLAISKIMILYETLQGDIFTQACGTEA